MDLQRQQIFLGADLGSVTTSLALAEVDADGRMGPPQTSCVRHAGDPLRPLLDLYAGLELRRLAGVVATGVHGDRLAPPVTAGLPEEVALEAAARRLLPWRGSAAVVRIGGGGFSVLARTGDEVWTYEANDRCSAGTGQAAERLCERFGCSLGDAAELAMASPDGVALTARCAVFAKSELTHFANQGADHGRLFRGYFEAVAQTVVGLAARIGAGAPLLLVGNGARITPLAAALAEAWPAPVAVSTDAAAFDALGALWFAAAHSRSADAAWPDDPAALVRERPRRIRTQPTADAGPGAVVRAAAQGWKHWGTAAPGAPDAGRRAGTAVLGLDLGSTGSKAALLDRANGEVLASVYRRTDGNPVEAARALVARILEMSGAAVVAVGCTGSGRDAAASVLRAAFAEAADRLTVQNEIVAHATAAARLDPDGGRSLSIVEIGGQDAKFISVRDGRVVDSDMNRVCSAGTGSFLEEQAVALGLDDIAGFGELAARATAPPDLGQTCTVFVTDLVAEALADGFSREDVFAGLQYSVIRNYRNRVMGNRRLLDKVFFQGKPATNQSLARTLAAVTGRDVVVPSDPGAMGAIGIALLADEAFERTHPQRDGEESPAPLDLRRLLTAKVIERRELRCGDKTCGNYCRIESAQIEVDGERRTVRSGGNCPKYEERGAVGRKLPREAPNPFHQRWDLLREAVAASEEEASAAGLSPAAGRPLAGLHISLPYAHYTIDLAPFFATFLRRLGARVTMPLPDETTLAAGERLCGAAGACAPVKLAHGLAVGAGTTLGEAAAARGDADAVGPASSPGGVTGSAADPSPGEDLPDVVLLPKVVNVPYPCAGAGRSTCPMAQGTPEMIATALAGRRGAPVVVRPVIMPRTDDDLHGRDLLRRLGELADELAGYAPVAAGPRRPAMPAALAGRPWREPTEAVGAAYAAALEDQMAYEAGLREIGEGALRFARREGFPVVVVVGETHVIHDPTLNSGIHDLVAANGALALPLDCYPLPPETPDLPRVHWASGGAGLRVTLAARAAGDVFPLLLGAFACGPNSMLEPLFADLLEGYPHAVFETDGHGGLAGYVTRVQAFLHAVDGYRAAGNGSSPVSAQRLARYAEPPVHSLEAGSGTRVVFGTVGGTLGRQMAAVLRGRGVEADFVGATDAEAMCAAQGACSGKECLPYQLVWGGAERYFNEQPPPDDGHTLLLSVGNGFRSCRANLFPLTIRLGLERLGLEDRVSVGDLSLLTGNRRMMPAAWGGLVAQDLLNALRYHHLAVERTVGDADAIFEEYQDRLERELEKRNGARGALADGRETVGRLETLIAAAAADHARLPHEPAKEAGLRDVLLAGDIFLRVDEWGNDDLQRRLADQGLRVTTEPFAEFFELLVWRDLQEQPRTSKMRAGRFATLRMMRWIVDRLVAAAQQEQPWVFWHDVRELEEASRELFDGYPFGETISTVGSALLTWKTRPIDGVVSVAPRGCGPALIAEALLRRRADIPVLYVYNDGDPIEQERLAGFAWRLRSRPARAVGAPFFPAAPGAVVARGTAAR
jgi:predicted CoA-substrate-specific enzyme activase